MHVKTQITLQKIRMGDLNELQNYNLKDPEKCLNRIINPFQLLIKCKNLNLQLKNYLINKDEKYLEANWFIY